jgi:SOS-response transcriptional repressor LexA
VPRKPRSPSTVTLRVVGVLRHGEPIAGTGDSITIAADKIDVGEVLFRSAEHLPEVGIAAGDLLIVEPRANGRAATGEFVIATLHDCAFIGRWWAKHGARWLLDDTFHVIAQGPNLVVRGAVTMILRRENH